MSTLEVRLNQSEPSRLPIPTVVNQNDTPTRAYGGEEFKKLLV
jgi:hypothetical protein